VVKWVLCKNYFELKPNYEYDTKVKTIFRFYEKKIYIHYTMMCALCNYDYNRKIFKMTMQNEGKCNQEAKVPTE